MVIDLHIHSSLSDGQFHPAEILEMADREGMDVISITDHDSIGSHDLLCGRPAPGRVKLIRGVEVSAAHGDTELHILGYFPGDVQPEFREFLARAQASRRDRLRAGVEELSRRGVDITYEAVAALARGESIGRAHLAQALVARWQVRNFGEAFDQYLRYDLGLMALTPTTVAEALAMIAASGGIPVWAHPELDVFDRHVEDFIRLGLRGVEVFNRRTDSMNAFYLERVAEDLDLFVTAGSDWHGHSGKLSHVSCDAGKVRRFLDQF
jgi:predicted metal-dependent phosphoesterase TrpH